MVKKLLSDENDPSHKRIIALLAFICLVVALIGNFFGVIIQADLVYIFGIIVLGQSGFSVFEKLKKNN